MNILVTGAAGFVGKNLVADVIVAANLLGNYGNIWVDHIKAFYGAV